MVVLIHQLAISALLQTAWVSPQICIVFCLVLYTCGIQQGGRK